MNTLNDWSFVLPTMVLPLQAQNERPNIILINIDDLGWTDIACNGQGRKYYETPNVDKFKANGIWFQEGYAGAANSAPSRACMLTGMNTTRHKDLSKVFPTKTQELLSDLENWQKEIHAPIATERNPSYIVPIGVK